MCELLYFSQLPCLDVIENKKLHFATLFFFKSKSNYEDSFSHLNTSQLWCLFNIHPQELSESMMKADT